MILKTINGKTPQIGEDCYIAENATIVGEVSMGNQCSIWFNAVLRGDVHFIKMGNKVNVQDGAVVHCTYQKSPTTIGNNVSIGHNAIVHGCTVKDNVLNRKQQYYCCRGCGYKRHSCSFRFRFRRNACEENKRY